MNKRQSSPSSQSNKQISNHSKCAGQQSNFIQKAYQLINNQNNSETIHWSKSGYTFIIEDIERFQREILPLYFRHNRYQSFVRQLNMYDFHKIRNGDYYCDNKSEFRHEEFYKGNLESILHIKRKGFQTKNKQKENNKNKKIQKNVGKKILKKKKLLPVKPIEQMKTQKPDLFQEQNSFFDISMQINCVEDEQREVNEGKIQNIVQQVYEHYMNKNDNQILKKSNRISEIIELAETIKDKWIENIDKISGKEDIKAMKDIYYKVMEQISKNSGDQGKMNEEIYMNGLQKNMIYESCKKFCENDVQLFQMNEEEALIESIFRAEIQSTLVCITSETFLKGFSRKVDTLMGF